MMARSGSGGGARRERAEAILDVQQRTYRWSTTITIDSEQASALLENMPRQRDLRESNVKYFVDLMKSGRMQTTHQGIACDEEGRLIDGQHRLTAVVRTGIPLHTQVTFNLSSKVFEAVDRGLKRTLADDFILTNNVSAKPAENIIVATRILFHVDHGRVPWSSVPKLELADLQRGIEHHLSVIDIDESVRRGGNSARCPRAPLTAFGTIFHEVNPELATSFIKKTLTGIDLDPGDPVLALRNSIIKQTGRHMPRNTRNALMVKIVRAWNAVHEGRKIRQLSRGMVEDNGNFEFPAISGYTPRSWT